MRMFYARGSCDDEDGFKKIVRAITRFKNCIVTRKPSGSDFRGHVVITRKLKCLKKDMLFFGEKGNFS